MAMEFKIEKILLTMAFMIEENKLTMEFERILLTMKFMIEENKLTMEFMIEKSNRPWNS
jgi:hypothetical protein